jgi:hypothetical protein
MPLKEELLQAPSSNPYKPNPPPTAQSFLTHLKTIGPWSGDDLQDCLETVQNSRGEAQFDYSPNPFN